MTYTEFNPSPLRINQWFGESRSAAITCDLLWQNAAGHTQCHLTCEESFQILVDRIESIRGDYTSAWSRYKEPLLICIHPPLIRTMTLSNHLIQCINIGRTAKENYDDVNSYSKIVFIINFCIILLSQECIIILLLWEGTQWQWYHYASHASHAWLWHHIQYTRTSISYDITNCQYPWKGL